MTSPQNPAGEPPDPWGQPASERDPGAQQNPGTGAQPYPGTQQYPGAQQQYPGAEQYPGAPQYPGTPQYPGAAQYPSQPYPGAPQYPAGTGYPGYAAPGYPPTPAARPERPSTIVGAFALWMIILAVGIVSTITLFSGDYLQVLQAQVAVNSQGEISLDAAKMIISGTLIVSMAISVFIYLFFGLKMVGGRNWARIVLTVLGGLSVLSGLSGGATVSFGDGVARPEASVVLGWLAVALAVIALVLMYLPTSNQYFTASKAYRTATQYGAH